MTGIIAVLPTHQFFDKNGNIAAGATLDTYAANTTDELTTWKDRPQTIENTNPIILDAQGQATIWLAAGQVYDFVLTEPLSSTLRTYEDVTGSTSSVPVASEWSATGLAPTFISATSFSVTGDQTATYSVKRRIKATISSGQLRYGYILSSVFSTVTTVTVILDSGSLDAGISAVDVGLISYQNSSIFEGIPPVRDLTGYGGADVTLEIGQSAIYTVTAASSLLLRIATGNNQEYIVNMRFNATSSTQAVSKYKPNNANPASVVSVFDTSKGGAHEDLIQGNAYVAISNVTSITRAKIDIETDTNSKNFTSKFIGSDAGSVRYAGTVSSYDVDTTTPITSLGTLDFINNVTGFVSVYRKL
ncbi:MAG: hypothetical protein WC901_01015 [Candidatus Margulisiibacteriota bacterium]